MVSPSQSLVHLSPAIPISLGPHSLRSLIILFGFISAATQGNRAPHRRNLNFLHAFLLLGHLFVYLFMGVMCSMRASIYACLRVRTHSRRSQRLMMGILDKINSSSIYILKQGLSLSQSFETWPGWLDSLCQRPFISASQVLGYRHSSSHAHWHLYGSEGPELPSCMRFTHQAIFPAPAYFSFESKKSPSQEFVYLNAKPLLQKQSGPVYFGDP